ncbi:MAG: hypothetical protein JRL30_06275 [Deltaproteobacteria bacterium]|nr:hypothetical protein [Deltaproteobacteria bacterium]
MRLRPGDVTFVAVRPRFARLGRLIDIGEDGLSFQYLEQVGRQAGTRERAAESFEIDIFVKDKKYYLPGMPCVVIYDKRSDQGETLPAGLETRRCGLQFKRLKKKQADQLDVYLETYAASSAS